MASQYKRGGSIELLIGGERYDAKGAFTYSIGNRMREAVTGVDGIHGYKETYQVAYIEGTITDGINVGLERLTNADNVTVLLRLANGKSIILSQAWFAGEGSAETDEGEISVRFEAVKAEELK